MRRTPRSCPVRRSAAVRRPVGVGRSASAAAMAAVLAVTGCGAHGDSSDGRPGAAPAPTAASPGPDAVPVVDGAVAEGLDVPWGVAVLPDGSALVSQRDAATVVRVEPDGGVEEVGEVPGVVAGGEGGLLGLALSPDFAADRLVYAYLTAADDNRIVRMAHPEDGSLGEPEVVLDGIPKARIHNGGRIAFGPDGHLYAGTGDASDADLAQDPDSLAGKVLRLTADGRPAPDNPDPSSPVWSLGHRNVQGMGWDSRGRMWVSEFGPDRDDELNLVEAGGNYGWPEVTGAPGVDGFVDAAVVWETSEASPSGLAVVGDAVYMAALRGSRLWQIPVAGEAPGQPRHFFDDEYGRLRSVVPAPDGSLWLVTNNTDGRGSPEPDDDRVLRVELT